MKSIKIENWFGDNIKLFPELKECKKYFENLEGEITEFSTYYKDAEYRFDFLVENSLSYVKPIRICITYNKDWHEIGSYSQKQVDTIHNSYYGSYNVGVSYNNNYDGGF